jgi:hypothetical protein
MADDEGAISDENPEIREGGRREAARLACQGDVGEVNRSGEGWVSHVKNLKATEIVLVNAELSRVRDTHTSYGQGISPSLWSV